MKGVFKDKSKLYPTYVPDELPHREEKLKAMKDSLEESLSGNSLIILQIIGEVGTGKTVSLLKLSRDYGGERIKFAYLNPRQHGTSRVLLYRQICRSLAPEAYSSSYSPEELLQAAVRGLTKQNAKGVIMFDDLDYFLVRSKEPVVYNLTRLYEIFPLEKLPITLVIFTAKSLKFRDYLERSELSSLGNRVLFFERYSREQIFDILQKRAEEAFLPGRVDEKVLEFISEITASPPINGDIRYAIDLLLNSGLACEAEGCSKITVDHVRKVVSITSPYITQEDIASLDEGLKKALLAVVRALKTSQEPYVSLDKIYTTYSEISREKDGLKDLVEKLQELDSRGIIEVKGLTKIGITGAPLESLASFLEASLQNS